MPLPRPRPRLAARAARALTGVAALALLCGACGSAGTTPRPASPEAPSQSTGGGASPSPRGSASAPASARAPFDAAGVALGLEPVTAIPGAPLAIAAPDDGSGRLFVADQGGVVWAVADGRRAEQPFLDISSRTSAGGERGLLGLAFHPDFSADPRFFIYYTNLDGDQVVAERRVPGADAAQADDAERLLLVMDDFAGNHNGGALAFGPDGHLYIATGDGGGAGDPQGTGQRLDTLLGKILRIDVDPAGDRPYGIPDGNPFAGQPGALPEIWHLGLRNPWRFSFDRATGDLWIGDVGQNAWEEVDVARGGRGGLNFGWNRLEGSHCFRPQSGCEEPDLTMPVTEYSHDAPGCTIIGGNVYRGSDQAALVGGYLFADYCSGLMWAIAAAADGPTEPVLVAETGTSPSALGEDEDGELYVTDIASGELLRVVGCAR